MIIRTEMRKVYIAEDDKSFDTIEACQKYNESLNLTNKRLSNIRCYMVSHSPDLTEGRGWYGVTYIAIECAYDHEYWLRDYCYNNFGNAVQMVQGRAPIIGWDYKSITIEDYEYAKGKAKVGDYDYQAKKVFLSNAGELIINNMVPFPEAKPLTACHTKIVQTPKG